MTNFGFSFSTHTRIFFGLSFRLPIRIIPSTISAPPTHSNWRAWGDAAGLHVAIEFPGRCFDNTFIEKSRKAGIRITPVEYHSICKGQHRDKLLLSYGHLDPDEIDQSVSLLKTLLDGC